MRLRYPMIPQAEVERLVGFFDEIFHRHGAEAVAVLVWERDEGRIGVHVPGQSNEEGQTRLVHHLAEDPVDVVILEFSYPGTHNG